MKIIQFIFFIYLFNLAVSETTECSSTYVILSPKHIRPGLNYEVTAFVENISEPLDVNLAIQKNGCNVAFTNVKLEAGVPQEAHLQIPADAANGNYEFLAFGSSSSGKFSFINKTQLQFEAKSKSVFIQTDKRIYKAGQLVRYRIFILSPEMKPLQSTFNGHISDPHNNRLKNFNNITVNNGVFTGEFQLTDQPLLGDWKINAEIEGQHTSKTFQVMEYVLPKFEVTVDLPSFVLMSEKELSATIKARYTFGKPISGKVKIFFEGDYSSFLIITYAKLKNGEAKARMNMRDLLSSKRYFGDKVDFTVTAIVTEDLTGAMQNGSSTVTLFRETVQLDVTKSSQFYKPGLKYLLYVKVSMPNKKPIPQNLKNRLSVKFFSQWGENENKENITFYEVPENGLVTVECFPPENVEYLYAQIKYGKVEVTETIQKFISPSNSYLQLLVKTDLPKVGQKIDFEINSTVPLNSLNYAVISHGTIITSNKLALNNEFTAQFSFDATAAMAPTARVLVYHARSDGEMVTDAIDVKIDGAIQNNVSINMESATKSDKDFAEPGQVIKVFGQAAPESFVGIAAVDQSVLLLGTGNDITVNDILLEMDSYNKKGYFHYEPVDKPMIFGRAGNRPIDGKDASEIFERSGMVVLSNSYIHSNHPDYSVHRYGAMGGGIRNKVQLTTFSSVPAMAEANEVVAFDDESQVAYSAAPSVESPMKPRKYFPETWLWFDMNVGSDGSFSNETIVPDSITTWVATAISLDSKLGFGVSTSPAKLRVFRPFFVSANLPFSVIRGETFNLQILIFNYLEADLDVAVSLEKSAFFTIGNVSGESGYSKTLKVASDKPTTVEVAITPIMVGEIDIIVSAKSSKAGDTEKKKLLVKPEGVTLYFNNPIFMDLTHSESFSEKVTIQIPTENVVEGSQRAEVSAIVDILGPTINHLESLVRMPYGCGEQNMINFVPNVIAAKYLTAINKFSGALKEKIITYIQNGYQRQFSYQRGDGSFSAFGNRDAEGSTWLTAFVAKSFYQAKPYIYFDKTSFKKALNWLATRVTFDNFFEERGKIIDHHIQGGVTGNVALTAYVVIAISDVTYLMKDKDSQVLNFTKSYLEKELDSLTSPFEIAIVTYALAKCNSSLATKAFEKLNTLAIKEDNVVHWSNPNTNKVNKYSPFKSTGESIQATGYALLSTLFFKDTNAALPIVKWLISQMTNVGGFPSTQDTVIGLEALAAFAEQTYSKDTNIEVTFSSDGFTQSMPLKSDDSLLLQTAEIPTFPQTVDIKATGKGSGFVQVSWKLNIKDTSESEYFDLRISTNSTFFGFSITACPLQKGELIVGMFVMEVTMPSGYSADSSLFSEILDEHPEIGRIEGRNDDTVVYVYFNEITQASSCITIEAHRVHIIENLKEVPVTLYAYYQPEKRITKMFKTPEIAQAIVPNENEAEVCRSQCMETC